MEFRFPYSLHPMPRPVVSLAGRLARPRPFIPLVVINPVTAQWVRCRGLVDSGADDVVFPLSVAELVGIDLSQAVIRTAQGMTGTATPIWYARVGLQLSNDEGDIIEWESMVAFCEKSTQYGLLGFAGFLQYFTTTFRGDDEDVELVPNDLMPKQVPTVVVQ